MSTATATATTPAQELLAIAKREAKKAKSWIELHNAVYGIGGPFGRLFPEQKDRTRFSQSDEYKAISALIEGIDGPPEDDRRPAAIARGEFLVRVPLSVHAALIKEAEAECVSLNQLVIAKLTSQLGATTRFVKVSE